MFDSMFRKPLSGAIFPYLAGIFLAAGIVFVFYSVCPNAVGISDDFYHTRIAVQGWNTYSAKTFPANTMSIWEKNFADKELGFHVLLDILNRINSGLGLPEYPFTFCRLTLLGILLAAFCLALYNFNGAAAWLFIPLLFCWQPYFLVRMLQLRPQVLSAALMLIGAVIFSRAENRKGFVAAFLLCLIYGWSYSNPHFILFPLGAFALAHFLHDKKRGVRLFCCGFAGLITSLIIHPQFPDNLVLWYVQCVMVVRNMIHFNGIILGGEVMEKGAWLYFSFLNLSLLAGFNLICVIIMLCGRNKKCMDADLAALSVLAFGSFAGIGAAMRAIEYALPFNLLLCSALLNRLRIRGKWMIRILCIVSAVALIRQWKYNLQDYIRRRPVIELREETAFIRKHFPAGTVIGNLNWQDFPALYYHLPEYRTLFGLEPFFSYCVYPERYLIYQAYFYKPRLMLPAEVLKRVLGTDIVLATDRHMIIKLKMMKDAEILFDNGSSIIARLH